jgi:3-phenylpropionate/cinnamic acid dioxygenase small subunit
MNEIAVRLAIHELLALHGHLVDAGEFERLDELFAADVVYDLKDFGLGVLRGVDAIRTASLQLGDRNPVAHHVTNVIIGEADAGGSVPVRSKGLAVNADGSCGSVVYHDLVVRTERGWRITYRKVIPRRVPLQA